MSILVILTAGYASWAALLFVMQRSMMFPGTGMRDMRGDRGLPTGAERVWIRTSGGEVEAWLVHAQAAGPAPVVIFAHGNAELIEDAWFEALQLRELGVATLLVEYPGYGRSEGRPSRASIMETFLAAYDGLAARADIDAGRIVGMGRSLGGGAITDLARQRPLRALVLQSTFTSVADLARRYLVPGILARDPFDNHEVVRAFEGPVLVIHGRSDAVIPHSHGERLARAAANAQLVSLECGHNDCLPEAYRAELQRFFEQAGILPPMARSPG